MDGKEIWNGAGVMVLLVVLAMGSKLICADKKVDGYYLSQGSSQQSMATCVYAHWTWHSDERAFCTNNYLEALDFVSKANASVKP